MDMTQVDFDNNSSGGAERDRTRRMNGKNAPEADGDCAFDDGLIGQRLGDKYLIQAPLGSGGMSVVYKGLQESVDRIVAIKTLKFDMRTDPVILQRFEREIKGLSRLNHPNIVTVFDCIVTAEGQPYVVMDFIDGESLEQLIEREKVLNPVRAVKLFSQVCLALEHAHRNGVVHRDVKPGNIMLAKNIGSTDMVKVVDFGLAKLMENSQQRLTATGQLWGSLPYMSPEQCMADDAVPIDSRTDIYSLGAVLYEALTGKDPFWRADALQILSSHINEVPVPLKEANPNIDVPPLLEAVVFKAMEKSPEMRFQTMQEFKDALSYAAAPMLKAEEDAQAREVRIKLAEQENRVKKQIQEKQNSLRKAQQKERLRAVPIIVVSSLATLALTVCGALLYSKMNSGAVQRVNPSNSAHAQTHQSAPTSAATASAHGGAPISGNQHVAAHHLLVSPPHLVTSVKHKSLASPNLVIKPVKHALKPGIPNTAAHSQASSKAGQRDYWGTLEGLHSGH